MHGGGNRICGRYMIIHNGQFAKCEVFENFPGLCGARTRTRTCKLVLEDARGEGLSSRTTTQVLSPTNSSYPDPVPVSRGHSSPH